MPAQGSGELMPLNRNDTLSGFSVSDVTKFPSSETVASPPFPKPWTFEQAQVVPKSLDQKAPQ
jgi:hypothetical protein